MDVVWVNPINVLIQSRMVGFWQRIINGKQDKISYKLYKILLEMHNGDFFHSKWLLQIKDCITTTDYLNFWESQQNIPLGLAKMVKLRLIDKYNQIW